MSLRICGAIFLTIVLSGLPACSGTRATGSVPESAIPPDFRLVIGKGGGFTGQWIGFGVRADGSAWRWGRQGARSDSTALAPLTIAELDSLWADVVRSNLLNRTTQGSGNLSARMEITARDTTVVLTWASGLRTDAPDLPEEHFYARAETLFAGHSTNSPRW